MISFTSLLGCKFCYNLPFYLADCNGQIYYVVHRFQSMSRMTIHVGVHNYLVMNGKCQEFVEEIRRLIAEELHCMPNAKISVISLRTSETFLMSYLFDDSSNDVVELLKGE